eukprot:1157715-Pelagomonas_calceolata.AAC.3
MRVHTHQEQLLQQQQHQVRPGIPNPAAKGPGPEVVPAGKRTAALKYCSLGDLIRHRISRSGSRIEL